MNTKPPHQLRGCNGYSSSGDEAARIQPSGGGFAWTECVVGDSWDTVGWYRTRRGAKAAASRHWGERLEWRDE